MFLCEDLVKTYLTKAKATYKNNTENHAFPLFFLSWCCYNYCLSGFNVEDGQHQVTRIRFQPFLSYLSCESIIFRKETFFLVFSLPCWARSFQTVVKPPNLHKFTSDSNSWSTCVPFAPRSSVPRFYHTRDGERLEKDFSEKKMNHRLTFLSHDSTWRFIQLGLFNDDVTAINYSMRSSESSLMTPLYFDSNGAHSYNWFKFTYGHNHPRSITLTIHLMVHGTDY